MTQVSSHLDHSNCFGMEYGQLLVTFDRLKDDYDCFFANMKIHIIILVSSIPYHKQFIGYLHENEFNEMTYCMDCLSVTVVLIDEVFGALLIADDHITVCHPRLQLHKQLQLQLIFQFVCQFVLQFQLQFMQIAIQSNCDEYQTFDGLFIHNNPRLINDATVPAIKGQIISRKTEC